MDLPVMPVTVEPMALIGASGKTARADAKDEKALKQAAQDFESVLLSQMLQTMRQTVDESGLLESSGGDQIQSLFYTQLAEHVSRQGGLGLWKQIYRQMAGEQAATQLKQDV
jgi:flagellar protein FlgJ